MRLSLLHKAVSVITGMKQNSDVVVERVMKTIGITGGVGSGKSVVMDILSQISNCIVLKADNLAKELEKRGEACYEPLINLLGDKILNDDLEIEPKKMSDIIFAGGCGELVTKVNEIVHPAVKSEILSRIRNAAEEGKVNYFFIEAALLIEDGYKAICDEIWYVYADETVRRERLKSSRGYSDEKIDSILSKQLSDDMFRQNCNEVIDNSYDVENTKKQLLMLIQ